MGEYTIKYFRIDLSHQFRFWGKEQIYLKIESVPGRFELIENDKDVIVIVDYAHTPMDWEIY